MALGYPMPVAVGTSLLAIASNSGAALVARIGDATVHWSVIIPFTAAAITSSSCPGHQRTGGLLSRLLGR